MVNTSTNEHCNTCRFWSQMIAQAHATGVEALCLSGESQFHMKYVKSKMYCQKWKRNTYGAVDEPPNYGEAAREAYERAEGVPPIGDD